MQISQKMQTHNWKMVTKLQEYVLVKLLWKLKKP